MVPAFLNGERQLRRGVRAAWALLLAFVGITASWGVECQPVSANAGIRQLVTNGNLVHLQVTVDKAETVATDRDFSDVLVGNAQTADIVALTSKTLYILGKKVGTTSISLLSADKRVMGVISVEVTYDLEGLRSRLREHVPIATSPSARSAARCCSPASCAIQCALSRAMAIAEQAAPQAITNALSVRSSQQVLLEVRFVEADRETSREIGVGWDVFGKHINAATGISGFTAGRCAPLWTGLQQRAVRRRHRPPARQRHQGRRHRAGAGEARAGTAAGRAQPRGAVGRHRKFPGGRRVSVSRAGRGQQDHGRVQEVWRRSRLHADRAGGRPHQHQDRAGGERARPDIIAARGRRGDPEPDRAAGANHHRASRRAELRHRRPYPRHQLQEPAPAALDRRRPCAR